MAAPEKPRQQAYIAACYSWFASVDVKPDDDAYAHLVCRVTAELVHCTLKPQNHNVTCNSATSIGISATSLGKDYAYMCCRWWRCCRPHVKCNGTSLSLSTQYSVRPFHSTPRNESRTNGGFNRTLFVAIRSFKENVKCKCYCIHCGLYGKPQRHCLIRYCSCYSVPIVLLLFYSHLNCFWECRGLLIDQFEILFTIVTFHASSTHLFILSLLLMTVHASHIGVTIRRNTCSGDTFNGWSCVVSPSHRSYTVAEPTIRNQPLTDVISLSSLPEFEQYSLNRHVLTTTFLLYLSLFIDLLIYTILILELLCDHAH